MISLGKKEGYLGLEDFELEPLGQTWAVNLHYKEPRCRDHSWLCSVGGSCLHRSQLLHPSLPVQERGNVLQQWAAELHLHLSPRLHWC